MIFCEVTSRWEDCWDECVLCNLWKENEKNIEEVKQAIEILEEIAEIL